MKSLIKLLIVLVFAFSALTATSCSTANLIRWGGDQTSIYSEPTGGFSRGILKPLVTVVGFPVALVWDVVTFPFQIIFGTYPYGDNFMAPGQLQGL